MSAIWEAQDVGPTSYVMSGHLVQANTQEEESYPLVLYTGSSQFRFDGWMIEVRTLVLR